MELNEQLINEALTANPELVNVLQGALKNNGFTVVKATDYEGLVKSEVDRMIGTKIGELHSNYDKDFSEFGIAKNANEKTYEYGKRVISTFKQESDQLKAQLEELKSKSPDDALKAEANQLRQMLAEKEKAITDFSTKFEQQSINYEIVSAQATIPINKNLPPLALNAAIEKIQSEVLKSARKSEDGSIFFVGADGNKLLDASTGQPKTAQQLLLERYTEAQLIEVRQQVTGGTGTGQPKQPTNLGVNGLDGKAIAIPSDVKSNEQFTAWAEKNIASVGKPFTATYNSAYLAWRKSIN